MLVSMGDDVMRGRSIELLLKIVAWGQFNMYVIILINFIVIYIHM